MKLLKQYEKQKDTCICPLYIVTLKYLNTNSLPIV